MQLSSGSDHTVWKIGNILTGHFRHLHGDSFTKRHVLQHRFWVGHRSMKVMQRVRWNPRLLNQVHHLGEG